MSCFHTGLNSSTQSFYKSLSKTILVFHHTKTTTGGEFHCTFTCRSCSGSSNLAVPMLRQSQIEAFAYPTKGRESGFFKRWFETVETNYWEIRNFDPSLRTTLSLQTVWFPNLCHDLSRQFEIPRVKPRSAGLTVCNWKSWYLDTETHFGMAHVAMLIRI